MSGLVIDLFAGGGGASTGLEAALGRPVDIAINHDPVALAAHTANHPRTVHLTADIFEVDPEDATEGRDVDILWASPDCTHFSVAKGGKPRSQEIRSLAEVVPVWAWKVRPRVIFLENVAEFQGWGPLGPDGRPIKERKGEDFKKWVGRLRALGYVVEWRVLVASHYGAPTSRKRLFLVARCDGEPVRWPAQTHGGLGLPPAHAAAECIDWSLPCPSIFERSKPLAEKTLWRIAQGIKRFVLESPAPFVLSIDQQGTKRTAASAREPLSTIVTKARHALVAPAMVQRGYGERKGQRARTLDLQQPLGTVVAQGQKHVLVSAFLAKHFGGVVGVPFDGRPLDTVTATDHHALVGIGLQEARDLEREFWEQDLTGAMHANGNHVAEVRAFLAVYYGRDPGQACAEPLRTITTKHRLGLVTVAGVDYRIADIGMRMLEPHELLKAQFGRFAATYDLSAATTKAAKVRLIGNSVCPEVAEAIVRENTRGAERRAA